MRRIARAALLAACFATAPSAFAGDFFLNGQLGRMDLDDSGFDDGQTRLLHAGAGYRWGPGMAQVGFEAGLGRLDELEGGHRTSYDSGYIDRHYAATSRYAALGASARIKPPHLPVYFIGRAGYLGMERRLDETAVDHSPDTAPVTERRQSRDTDGGTYMGVGVGTTVLPLLDIGLMYNEYRYSGVQYDPARDEYRLSGDKRDARSVSLSAELRF